MYLRAWSATFFTIFSVLICVQAGLDDGGCECLPGKSCDFKKWSGAGTECECECWDTDGKCTATGWKRVKGEGTCDFDAGTSEGPAPLQPCECPPGLTCEFKKSSGAGTECECECWDLTGKCTIDGWKRTAGKGSCDFVVDDVTPGPAPRKACACPAGTTCEFQKISGTGTECECECWDSKGKCTSSGWKRTKGTGSCDFDANPGSPSPLQPCQCPPGLTCEFKKSTGSGTECECGCWDSAGKCTADGWERTKGSESCDFEAVPARPAPAPARPTATIPAPTPATARATAPAPGAACECPPEATCEYFKVSPSKTECQCSCWDSNGKCTADGWKVTKGEGSCDFGASSQP